MSWFPLVFFNRLEFALQYAQKDEERPDVWPTRPENEMGQGENFSQLSANRADTRVCRGKRVPAALNGSIEEGLP